MGMLTGDFYSEQLKMTTQIRVLIPDVSNDVTPLFDGEPKVLYLLHGLSGSSGMRQAQSIRILEITWPSSFAIRALRSAVESALTDAANSPPTSRTLSHGSAASSAARGPW